MRSKVNVIMVGHGCSGNRMLWTMNFKSIHGLGMDAQVNLMPSNMDDLPAREGLGA